MPIVCKFRKRIMKENSWLSRILSFRLLVHWLMENIILVTMVQTRPVKRLEEKYNERSTNRSSVTNYEINKRVNRQSIPSREVSILWSYLDITLLFSSYVYLIFIYFIFSSSLSSLSWFSCSLAHAVDWLVAVTNLLPLIEDMCS